MKLDKEKITVPFDGGEVRVSLSPRTDYRETYRKRMRKSRVFVYTDEKFNLAEDFVNRTRRPFSDWRKIITPALEQMGFDTKGMRWSQYAFCTCPCSPGFILSKRYEKSFQSLESDNKYFFPYDIDICISGDVPNVDESIPVDPGRAFTITKVLEGAV